MHSSARNKHVDIGVFIRTYKGKRMSRLLLRPALFLCVVLVIAVVSALGQSPQLSPVPGPCLACSTDSSSSSPYQIFPWKDPNEEITIDVAAPGAHLTYFGGPVISNVRVVQ